MVHGVRWSVLVIGYLSSSILSAVAAEAQAGVARAEDGRGGLSGGSFWRWASPSENEPTRQGEALHMYTVAVVLLEPVGGVWDGVHMPKCRFARLN